MMKNCPFCAEEILDEAKKCKHCGEYLDEELSNRFRQAEKLPRSRWVFIILGLFLGWLGIHNFYAGYHGRGTIQLIITFLLWWIGLWMIVWLIAVIEVLLVNEDAEDVPMK